MPPEIQNKNTIATANAKNPFMNMSREELLAWKEQNPQFFQEQEGAGGATRGGNALETLRGVGDIWSGGKSFTFDPSTGKPYAVETGVKRPAAGGAGDLNTFIQKELLKQRLGKPEVEKKATEAISKSISDIQTKGAVKGIDIGEPRTPQEARTALAEGIRQQEKTKIQAGAAKELREQTKFEKEEKEKEEKAKLSTQLIQNTTDELLDSIKEVKKGIKFFGPKGLLPAIPGLQNEKVLWQANLEKLLSKRILALMSELKQASRTGATGFGQLSEKELRVLQEGSTALRKFLSEKDALNILNKMEAKLLKIKTGGKTTPITTQGLPTTVGQPTNGVTSSGIKFTIEQ